MHLYVCRHAQPYTYTHTNASVIIYTSTCIYAHNHKHTHARSCTNKHARALAHRHTQTNIHSGSHPNTHTHTHSRTKTGRNALTSTYMQANTHKHLLNKWPFSWCNSNGQISETRLCFVRIVLFVPFSIYRALSYPTLSLSFLPLFCFYYISLPNTTCFSVNNFLNYQKQSRISFKFRNSDSAGIFQGSWHVTRAFIGIDPKL